MAIIHTLVEGLMHEAAADRIIKNAGHTPGACVMEKDPAKLRAKALEVNQPSAGAIYMVLVDFIDTGRTGVNHWDWGLTCPAQVVSEWVPDRQPNLLFRIIVRELESWLLVDTENLQDFLRLKRGSAIEGELYVHPKATLLGIARRSRSKRMREALVDNPSSSTLMEGRLYTSEMVRFIQERWDISNARRRSPSLDKCCARLEEVAE
jgi:hypothetical protein